MAVTTMALEAAKKFSFVVDNTVADVACAQAANPFLSDRGLATLYAFPAANNILILNYGVRLPHCFVFSSPMPTISLGWARASDGANLNYFANLLVPIANEFISLAGSQHAGLFQQHYSLTQPDPGVAGKLACALGGTVPRVSMIGVPDILNGTTQYIDCFVTIQHQGVVS